jgi:hypothetical protein
MRRRRQTLDTMLTGLDSRIRQIDIPSVVASLVKPLSGRQEQACRRGRVSTSRSCPPFVGLYRFDCRSLKCAVAAILYATTTMTTTSATINVMTATLLAPMSRRDDVIWKRSSGFAADDESSACRRLAGLIGEWIQCIHFAAARGQSIDSHCRRCGSRLRPTSCRMTSL